MLTSQAMTVSRAAVPVIVTWLPLKRDRMSLDSSLLGRTTATSKDGGGGGGSSFSIPGALGYTQLELQFGSFAS